MKSFNSLRPILNRRHFADDIFKCIFENENEWISPKISMKFVPNVQINDIPALVQIMAWRRPGDKPLSEPMMVSLLTHISVTRPQWVKPWCQLDFFTVEILFQPAMVSKHSLMDRWGKICFYLVRIKAKQSYGVIILSQQQSPIIPLSVVISVTNHIQLVDHMCQ